MSANGTDGHYDAVVVGSGFGGSVTAYRLAQARPARAACSNAGRAYPPGSFPRRPKDVAREASGIRAHGLARHVRLSGRSVGSTRSCRAASAAARSSTPTSCIRKDEHWFRPAGDRATAARRRLAGHAGRPRSALRPRRDHARPQRLPFATSPATDARKTIALRDAAEGSGMEWQLVPARRALPQRGPPAGTRARRRRAEPFGNLHGRLARRAALWRVRHRAATSGAKNTLDYNYLTRAAATTVRDLRTAVRGPPLRAPRGRRLRGHLRALDRHRARSSPTAARSR